MATIYLATVKAWNPATSAEVTLNFSTARYVSKPTDSPANTWYDPCIQQPAFLRRDAWGSRRTQGRSSMGYGELVLVNDEGLQDYLNDYSFDGRSITLSVGVLTKAGATPTWTTVLSGTIEQAVFSWSKLTLRIRDRQIELDKPIQTNKYAGNNSLPNGLEGVEGDLKGKPKPLVYGSVYNIAPPCVNTSKLIYQVNDGSVSDVAAVYDSGIALTKGADYSSSSDMTTTAPAASTYRILKSGGYIRLGSSPAGALTADVVQGSSAANRTLAQVVKVIVTGPGGIASGSVSSSDLTTLDVASSAVVGIYVDDETTIADVLDQLCTSLGCYWGFDRTGVFRIRQLLAPSGTSAATLTATDVVAIERATSKDEDKGIPSWRINVKYKRFWTVQTSGLAGAVTDARKAEVAQEWRTASVESASVKTAHPLAPELNLETLLTTSADASAEATRRLNLYGTRRDIYDVSAMVAEGSNIAVDIGDCVTLQLPRYGLASGRQMRVIGVMPDLRQNRLDLTLWG